MRIAGNVICPTDGYGDVVEETVTYINANVCRTMVVDLYIKLKLMGYMINSGTAGHHQTDIVLIDQHFGWQDRFVAAYQCNERTVIVLRIFVAVVCTF